MLVYYYTMETIALSATGTIATITSTLVTVIIFFFSKYLKLLQFHGNKWYKWILQVCLWCFLSKVLLCNQAIRLLQKNRNGDMTYTVAGRVVLWRHDAVLLTGQGVSFMVWENWPKIVFQIVELETE